VFFFFCEKVLVEHKDTLIKISNHLYGSWKKSIIERYIKKNLLNFFFIRFFWAFFSGTVPKKSFVTFCTEGKWLCKTFLWNVHKIRNGHFFHLFFFCPKNLRCCWEAKIAQNENIIENQKIVNRNWDNARDLERKIGLPTIVISFQIRKGAEIFQKYPVSLQCGEYGIMYPSLFLYNYFERGCLSVFAHS